MKFPLLIALSLFTGFLSAQIITPAYVISNSARGIKSVTTEERSEFKDFRTTSIVSYNKHGFPKNEMQFSVTGEVTAVGYVYEINEDDSTITVTKSSIDLDGQANREVFNYRFSKGSLWESKPVDSNQPVMDYKRYMYDDNWNLVALDELKIIGGDTNVTKRHRYSVQTDVFHKLVSTSHSEIGSRTDYYYDEGGLLLSKAVFDGPVKRTTEHRLYNGDNLLAVAVEVLNRGGNLMGIKRYSYDTYRKGKQSIFEKWMPVAHPESVMQER